MPIKIKLMVKFILGKLVRIQKNVGTMAEDIKRLLVFIMLFRNMGGKILNIL
jgi:hypothetical protein